MACRKRPGPEDIIWIREPPPFPVETMLLPKFHCPRCEKHVQLYLPKLSEVCLDRLGWLIFRYQETGKYVRCSKVPSWLRELRTISVLKHWGFVKLHPNIDPTKRTSGMWRPTSKGIRFMRNLEPAYEYAAVYNDKLYGWAGPEVQAREVDGSFNYSELMERGERYLYERISARKKAKEERKKRKKPKE